MNKWRKPKLDQGEYGVRLWLDGEKLVPSWEDVICQSVEEADEYINCELFRECVTAEIVDWTGKVVARYHFC